MNSYYERPTTSNTMEPCECKAPLTVAQLAQDLNGNLLEMKDVIDSINKCIFATETDVAIESNGTIDSLYSILLFDREVSGNLVECLKIIRDKLW